MVDHCQVPINARPAPQGSNTTTVLRTVANTARKPQTPNHSINRTPTAPVMSNVRRRECTSCVQRSSRSSPIAATHRVSCVAPFKQEIVGATHALVVWLFSAEVASVSDSQRKVACFGRRGSEVRRWLEASWFSVRRRGSERLLSELLHLRRFAFFAHTHKHAKPYDWHQNHALLLVLGPVLSPPAANADA